ncbi:hypothetical protein Tco_1520258, partial [Tanacetum coccineum]
MQVPAWTGNPQQEVIKNPIYHSKTKHIETSHHFIRDSYEKRLIEMVKIHTDNNVADLLTKAFDVSRFNFLVASIGRDTKIPQSGGPPIKVGDEVVHKELGDRMERAATTASSLEAEQESGLQRLRKVGESSRVESFEDTENLGAQEDASKQGRIKIVDETQGRLDDAEMFDIDDLHGDEVFVDIKINEREVSTSVEDNAAPTILVTTADEGVIAAKIDEIIPTSAPTIVIDELTLAQTLIEIKAAKPKAV